MTLEYMGEAHESPTVLMRGRLEGWGWKRQREIPRCDAVSTDCGGGNQEPKTCSEAGKGDRVTLGLPQGRSFHSDPMRLNFDSGPPEL